MADEIERATRLAKELARLYGPELASVVLYGSAARGEYRAGSSDLNLLVLLRDPSPAHLRRAAPAVRAWASRGDPPPTVFGWDEWRRSADVFPLELADMREAHRVLHGADPFEGLVVDPEHLRLQLEHELKGKFLRLRRHYLLHAAEPAELGTLLARSLSTFLALFRGALRLAGDSAAGASAEAVIRRTAQHAGCSPDALLALLAARGDEAGFRPTAEDPVASGYIEAIHTVVQWVDRRPTGGGA